MLSGLADFLARTSASSGAMFTVSVASIVQRTMAARSIALMALSIPICSTVSSVSRSPAVSKNRNRMPFISRVSSITSRVVPGMSLTMARSSPEESVQ